MKYIVIVSIFFSSFFLGAEENESKLSEIIHIYLCSRLTETAKEWNNEITQEFDEEFDIFRPQDIDLSHYSLKEQDLFAYTEDLIGMKKSDLLLVLPPYGRDCAWEIGWFSGKEKPAIAYAESEGDWLCDAMIKGGLTAIITDNKALYQLLLEDPATKNKCHLISTRKLLPQAIKEIIK